MIRLTTIDGQVEFVAAGNIARITVAGTSSQWHGVRAIVRLFDGALIEARESAESIRSAVEESERKESSDEQ